MSSGHICVKVPESLVADIGAKWVMRGTANWASMWELMEWRLEDFGSVAAMLETKRMTPEEFIHVAF